MTDALVRVASAGKPVFAVTELIDEAYLLEPPEFQGHHDPHVWMDPGAWAKALEVVRDALSELDRRARRAIPRPMPTPTAQELAAARRLCRARARDVPSERRVLVTAHDAFNYFGRRYGFEVQGIQGISTESEAGLRRIEELVDLIVERGSRRCSSRPRCPTARAGAGRRRRRARPGGGDRRRAVLRRDGRARHLRGHLRRHDRPQRDHDRPGAGRRRRPPRG